MNHLETCQFTSRTLRKMKLVYVNDGAYRFWANCVLGNVDIYMLVVPVDGGLDGYENSL